MLKGEENKQALATTQECASDRVTPVAVTSYFVFSSLFRAAFGLLWVLLLFLVTRLEWTARHSSQLCGMGLFHEDGATQAQRDKAKFEQVFVGYGWADQADVVVNKRARRSATSTCGGDDNDNDDRDKKARSRCSSSRPGRRTDMPNKVEVLRIAGPDPNYVTSGVCLVQCAITLLKEEDRLCK